MPPKSSQPKNSTIGNYNLGKTIGEGTFGKVRLATHKPSGEKVAVKILEKVKIQEQSDVERVAKEIQILKKLRHPHIIQLYEIIETPDELYLIMEYANGGELFDHIVKNSKIKEKEACRFFHQILSGVEYIHKLGVVHRDLKPENLLLDYNLNIKIVDFGLSNIYKKGETLKTACGSPCYAAPEMIAGKRYHGLQVDIWSCGVIMFALICGYLPFEDPNTTKLYKKIISGDFEIPNFVSNDAKDLLCKILNTDPQKRYSINDIISHKWSKQIQYKLEDIKGIIIGLDQIELDNTLIEQLKIKFNIDQQQTRKMVINNRHNDITTLYYLMKEQNRRERASKNQAQLQLENKQNIEEKEKEKKNADSQQKDEFKKYIEEESLQSLKRDEKEKEKVKVRTHIPPIKLQFNIISQAVNNSISSVGTNTSNTPLTTQRKVENEYRQVFTDRGVVDRPMEEKKWNNSSMVDERQQIKSISQHSEIKSKSPTILSNKAKLINMTYFMQQKPHHTDNSLLNDSINNYMYDSMKTQSSRNPKSATVHSNTPQQLYGSNIKNTNQKSSELKSHSGPFNLKCVTNKSPQLILENIFHIFRQLQIRFKYVKYFIFIYLLRKLDMNQYASIMTLPSLKQVSFPLQIQNLLF